MMRRIKVKSWILLVGLGLGASMGGACGPLPPTPLAKPSASASPSDPLALGASSAPGISSEEGAAPEKPNAPQAEASPGVPALPETAPSSGPSLPSVPSGGISGPAQATAAPPQMLEDGPTPTDPTVEVDLGASAPEDGRFVNPNVPIEGRAQ